MTHCSVPSLSLCVQALCRLQHTLQQALTHVRETLDKRWSQLLQRSDSFRLCVVCKTRPKEGMLLPCNHLCLCLSCLSAWEVDADDDNAANASVSSQSPVGDDANDDDDDAGDEEEGDYHVDDDDEVDDEEEEGSDDDDDDDDEDDDDDDDDGSDADELDDVDVVGTAAHRASPQGSVARTHASKARALAAAAALLLPPCPVCGCEVSGSLHVKV